MVSDLDDEELIKLIREGNVKVSFFLGDKTIDRNIQINNFLKRLGLPEHLEGHKLLEEIFKLCLEDDSYLYNMKNKLFKELSKKYNLRLVESTKFSETEQLRIKEYIE